MYQDNEARDLPQANPRGPAKQDGDKQAKELADRARKISRLKKQIADIEKSNGVGSFFSGVLKSDSTKRKEKEMVINALANDLDVHEHVLDVHNLRPESNPPVPDEEDDGAPF